MGDRKTGRGAKAAEWARLEQLVLQWNSLAEADVAKRVALNFEMTDLLTAVIPEDKMDALGAVWLELGSYEPGKGEFSSFVLSRLNLRTKDQERADLGMSKRKLSSGAAEHGTGRRSVYAESLNRPIAEGDETERLDLLPDESPETVESGLRFDATMQELVALILTLPERLHGQARNPKRINLFRMFFTDGVVASIYSGGAKRHAAHERDLFCAIKTEFLDFFMQDICRTVQAIFRSSLKPYGQMVPGREMQEPGQPLPNDVYLAYLRECEGTASSPAAISNGRTAYCAFLRQNLC